MIKIITESLSGENVIDWYTNIPSSAQPQFYNMNNCKKIKIIFSLENTDTNNRIILFGCYTNSSTIDVIADTLTQSDTGDIIIGAKSDTMGVLTIETPDELDMSKYYGFKIRLGIFDADTTTQTFKDFKVIQYY